MWICVGVIFIPLFCIASLLPIIQKGPVVWPLTSECRMWGRRPAVLQSVTFDLNQTGHKTTTTYDTIFRSDGHQLALMSCHNNDTIIPPHMPRHSGEWGRGDSAVLCLHMRTRPQIWQYRVRRSCRSPSNSHDPVLSLHLLLNLSVSEGSEWGSMTLDHMTFYLGYLCLCFFKQPLNGFSLKCSVV